LRCSFLKRGGFGKWTEFIRPIALMEICDRASVEG